MTTRIPIDGDSRDGHGQPVYLVANGDLRLSANVECWPVQERFEESVSAAVAALGRRVVRAHPFDRAAIRAPQNTPRIRLLHANLAPGHVRELVPSTRTPCERALLGRGEEPIACAVACDDPEARAIDVRDPCVGPRAAPDCGVDAAPRQRPADGTVGLERDELGSASRRDHEAAER